MDIEEITINYPSMWELLSDLRDTGESNAILGRRGMISRDVLLAAEGIYRELYQKEEDSIPATFQVIFMVRGLSLCSDLSADWLETRTDRAQAPPKRIGPDKPQGHLAMITLDTITIYKVFLQCIICLHRTHRLPKSSHDNANRTKWGRIRNPS